jgi:hypothetical protein
MYSNNKLIASSENLKDRLLSYLKVQVLNDKPGVLALIENTNIDEYYLYVSDFRQTETQVLFLNKETLLQWKKNRDKRQKQRKIYTTPQSFKEPYFYINDSIKINELMLIQNVVEGEKDVALSVCNSWSKNRINSGYNSNLYSDVDKYSYKVYDTDGTIVEEKQHKKESPYSLLQTSLGYSAILFF